MRVTIANQTSSCINFRWTGTGNDVEIKFVPNNVTSVQLAAGGRAVLSCGEQTVVIEVNK